MRTHARTHINRYGHIWRHIRTHTRTHINRYGHIWRHIRTHTGSIREIETTVFDPASVFLSTHWWSQHPASQFLAKEACSFYKRDLFRRFSAHPASVFLKHSGRNWAKSRLQFLSASFYVPEHYCTYIWLMMAHAYLMMSHAYLMMRMHIWWWHMHIWSRAHTHTRRTCL